MTAIQKAQGQYDLQCICESPGTNQAGQVFKIICGARLISPGRIGQRRRLSLIPSLIHPRTSASISVYDGSLSRQADHSGQSCTVIRNPEKRKVGGSTPPLTTTSSRRIWPADLQILLAPGISPSSPDCPWLSASRRHSPLTGARRVHDHLLANRCLDLRSSSGPGLRCTGECP